MIQCSYQHQSQGPLGAIRKRHLALVHYGLQNIAFSL